MDQLWSDVRGSGGPDTVRQIQALQPDMAILFVSGYPLEDLENRGLLLPAKVTLAEIEASGLESGDELFDHGWTPPSQGSWRRTGPRRQRAGWTA